MVLVNVTRSMGYLLSFSCSRSGTVLAHDCASHVSKLTCFDHDSWSREPSKVYCSNDEMLPLVLGNNKFSVVACKGLQISILSMQATTHRRKRT